MDVVSTFRLFASYFLLSLGGAATLTKTALENGHVRMTILQLLRAIFVAF